MLNSKEELLSSCYALRAGLSVISTEKDKVDQLNNYLEESKEKTETKISNLNEKLEKNRADYAQTEAKMQQAKFALKNCLPPSKQYKEELLHAIKKNALKLFIPFLLLALTIFFVHIFYVAIKIDNTGADPEVVFANYPAIFVGEDGAISIFWALLSLTALIVYVIGFRLYDLSEYESLPSLKILNCRWEDKHNTIIVCEKNLKTFKKNIDTLNKTIASIKEEHHTVVKKSEERSKILIDDNNLFYKALKETFAHFLDIRDWQHIDLLIFYFETGRADDLKEALLLLDRQTQNNALINAIQDASSSISTTIKEGLENLQNGLAKSFSLLSKQIHTMQLQLHEYHQEQMSLGYKQLEGLSELSNQTRMNNALIEKANVTSVALMKDVTRMKELAEYDDMRKRYNLK